MRTHNVLICLVVIVSVARAGSFVREVDADTVTDLFDGSKHVFFDFFAPWCRPCQRLAPEYEKVGKTFAGSSEVVIAKVNCELYRDVCMEHGITGYPTLRWYPKNDLQHPVEYDLGRNAFEITAFINQMIEDEASKLAPPPVEPEQQ